MTWTPKPSNHYYALVASLPAMPADFRVDRLPITPRRLDERLAMLHAEDARVVRQLRDFLRWDRHRLDRSDAEVIAHYERLVAEVTNPVARSIIEFRLDVRTLLSGLRRRRRGLPPPDGVGQWVDAIRRNWSEPCFRLQRIHPWLEHVSALLPTTDCLALDKVLLEICWRQWTRMAQRHHFTFEAVLLYLARWEIVRRWVGRDQALGRKRFDKLLTETLHDHAHLYQ